MQFPRIVWCFVLVGLLPPMTLEPGAPVRPNVPVLLVHGITWDVDGENQTWGCCTVDADKTQWNGMIGFLESQGLPFGGVIHFKNGGRPKAVLDAQHTTVESSKASVFALQFSPHANTDGIAYKALELAQAIRLVREVTGASKVRIVAHSAGGLVARVYVQSALPGVMYRGDVDRLITIATPHLGSSLASHFGDYLGTRATSIAPTAALVRDLNNTLDLPAETGFASIVVRAVAADSRDEGDELDDLVDKGFLERLPVEYRLGGDQAVHVQSQNLRLARCAARYEAKTGRPVQYVLARVADRSPRDWAWNQKTAHVAASQDPTVQRLVLILVGDHSPLWRKGTTKELAAWIDWQARLHAHGTIEAEALRKHRFSQVSQVKLSDLTLVDQDGGVRTYDFQGEAFSKNRLLPLRRRWTNVSGFLHLTFDPFGRVRTAGP